MAMQADRTAPEGEPTRVALVGFGRQMQSCLIPSILQCNTAQIVAINSRGANPREVIKLGGVSVPLERDILRASEKYGITHVVAATNPAHHYEIASECCELGIDCYIEKSPCMSSEQLLSMIEREESAASCVAVGLNFRYATLFQKAVEIWRDHFSAVRGIARVSFRGHVSEDMERRYSSRALCVLLELGVHVIDLACHAFGADHLEDYQVINDGANTIVLCKLSNTINGDVVHLNISAAEGPFESSMELLSSGGGEVRLNNFSEIKILDPQQRIFKDSVFGGKAGHTYAWPTRRSSFDKNGYSGCLKAFFVGRGPTLQSLVRPYEIIGTLTSAAGYSR